MKTCNKCLIDKSLDEFYKLTKSPDGFMASCISCEKKRQHIKWEKYKDVMYARSKKWAQENPDKIYKSKKRQAERNPQRFIDSHKTWVNKNREYIRNSSQKRRAMVRNNGLYTILTRDLRRLYSSSCIYCGATERISADHVIPIVCGGVHSIGNLVPACISCNSSKGDKLLVEWRMGRSRPRAVTRT